MASLAGSFDPGQVSVRYTQSAPAQESRTLTVDHALEVLVGRGVLCGGGNAGVLVGDHDLEASCGKHDAPPRGSSAD